MARRATGVPATGTAVAMLTWCVFAAATRQVVAFGTDPDAPTIVIHVEDRAHLSAFVSERARTETVRIFAAAGVRAIWVDGRAAAQDGVRGDRHITVVILDIAGTAKITATERLGPTVAGLAIRGGNRAYIFDPIVAYGARHRNR